MSVGMSLLAILDEGPTYGLQLKNHFEHRTGGVWPLNVGQVYTTLQRLQRDGLVEAESPSDGPESQKIYGLTPEGRERLEAWFREPAAEGPPAREELVLKLVMAARKGREEALGVVQNERRGAIQLLQEYTRLKRDGGSDADLGWLFLLDSLIFSTEARVRWLDACESRIDVVRTWETTSSRSRLARHEDSPEEVSS